MLLNYSLSLINLLQVRSRFDLHQEWTRLTKSNQRATDVTFAEFSAAFDAIQKAFVDSPDMSPWRREPGGLSSLRSLVGRVTSCCRGVRDMTDSDIERAAVEAIRFRDLVLWPGDRILLDRVAYVRSCRAAAACSIPRAPAPVATRQFKGREPNEADSIARKDKIDALVRQLGDAIALGEGNYESYNSGTDGPHGKVLHSFPRGAVGTVTGKTINEILANESKPSSDPTRLFTTGKYQTIIPTLADAKKKLGLTGEEKYTAEIQERVFREFLLFHAGGSKHTLAQFIFNGEGAVAEAQYAASKEWASIAAPRGKKIKDGRVSDGTLGYHEKDGQNKAKPEATKKFVGALQEIYNAR